MITKICITFLLVVGKLRTDTRTNILRMMPKAAKMLAKMVMKTESPSPKTNLSISSWCLLSSGVTQLLFLKPMNSFCPERHSITPTSSSSIPVVLV